jgi:hypothetical protein
MYSKLIYVFLIGKILTDEAYIKMISSFQELLKLKVTFLKQSIYIDNYSDNDLLTFSGKICLQNNLEDFKTNCIQKYDNYNSRWVYS